ncbi:MAG: glycerol-3-phosphate 1-O-acyltransferase PlsY [Xanthomonadales bacterium]|nr:glycerol-3-phosphate 1-O-acyltransferase PlsY [Xanthomonadales bacterium]
MLSVVCLVLAYLLGSLSGSLLLGRIIGVDIRRSGSGNAGGTNAFRTRGWRFALGVVVIDVGKGALAACVPAWLSASSMSLVGLQAACILVAAAGHTWPIFFGFRGGKGAAVLLGGLMVFWPSAVLVVIAVWLVVLVLSGYVGLATMLATSALLPWAVVQQGATLTGALLFALAASVFIVFTHRANVQRLWAGNEHRFEKLRLFARRRGRASGSE